LRNDLFKLRVGQVFKYLVPIYAVYAFAVILPLILSLVYSTYDDYGKSFAGIEPYLKLLKDSDFWFSFKNNLILVAICVAGQVGIAFVIASLLMSRVLKWKSAHRMAIFLPVVLAPVVTGYLWTLFYNYQFGILNRIVDLFGGEPILWLDDPKKAIYLVSIPLVWQYIGLYLIIFLAGMQNISKEIYDAVEIDGANWRQKTVYITFPLLKGVTQVALVLCISGTMKTFDHIFVMTGGGPGRSTMVMAQYAYNNAFLMTKLGYASTLSVGMIVLSGAVVLLVSKLIGGNKDRD